MNKIVIGFHLPSIKLELHQIHQIYDEDLYFKHEKFIDEIVKIKDFRTIFNAEHYEECILQICHSKFNSMDETLKYFETALEKYQYVIKNIIVEPIKFVKHYGKIGIKFKIIDPVILNFCYYLCYNCGINTEPYCILVLENLDHLRAIFEIKRKIYYLRELYEDKNIIWKTSLQFQSICIKSIE
jgi:hypothetical protein